MDVPLSFPGSTEDLGRSSVPSLNPLSFPIAGSSKGPSGIIMDTDMDETPDLGESVQLEMSESFGEFATLGGNRFESLGGSVVARLEQAEQTAQAQSSPYSFPMAAGPGGCHSWPPQHSGIPRGLSRASGHSAPTKGIGLRSLSFRSGASRANSSFLGVEAQPSSTLPLSRHGTFVVARSWVATRPVTPRRTRRSKLRVYCQDPFFSAVHQPWYRLLLVVFSLYLVSWTFYGLFAYVAAGFYKNKPQGDNPGPDQAPGACITEAKLMFDYFYWSAVTMSTLGYGYYRATCAVTVGMVPVMLVHGGILDAVVFGLVFAKFSSPANRAKTLLISEGLCGSIRIPGVTDKEAGVEENAAESSLTLSFRIVNARKHTVMHPQLEVYLVDHRPLLENGDPPCFHLVPFEALPPMTFLEFPCTVTCNFAIDGPTPLHDMLTTMTIPGLYSPDDAARPLRTHEPLMETLALVAVFTAEETANGSSFEVRRTWPLSDVQWGHCFVPMLTARSPDNRGDREPHTASTESLLLPEQRIETVVDMAKLDETMPIG